MGASGDKMQIQGPAIRLTTRALLSLTMALKELATNAARLGPLSSEGRKLALTWQV